MKKTLLFLFLVISASSYSQQVWRAMKTSENLFTSARDGHKIAWLRKENAAYSMGGWAGGQVVYNEFYKSTDKGLTWPMQPAAAWPATNDFIVVSSVTGDTLVKYGGDNTRIDNKRIDIFTTTNGWQQIGSWPATVNDGLLLTGCRHKQYYYMLGNNGKLSRFTLDNPVPQVIRSLGGDTSFVTGFMISLPNGRLIMGSGKNRDYGVTGKLWYSDDDGYNWALLTQHNIFKTYWSVAVVLKSAVIYWAGRDDIANVKGAYYIPIENLMNGTDVNDWKLLTYTPSPRHAQGVCAVLDSLGNPTDEAIGVTGNIFNDSWIFKRVDNFWGYDNQDVYLNSNCSFTVPDFTANLSSLSNGGASFTQLPAAGTVINSSPGQTHQMIITAHTGNGHTETNSFFLRGRDTLKPVFTCPSNSLVYAGSNCTVVVPDMTAGITAHDCSAVTFSQLPAAGMVLSGGIDHIIAIRATDAFGNSSVCNVTITQKDTTAPVFAALPLITRPSEAGKCEAHINITVPGATDNCSAATVTGTRSDNLAFTDAFPVGTTTISWKAVDSSGNAKTSVQVIVVTDLEKPVLSVPSYVPACNTSDTISIPALQATDNCGIDKITYSITGTTTRSGTGADASGSFNQGLSTIKWTVVDINGNASIGLMNVNVPFPLRVNIPDTFIVSQGTAANTLYIGYGPSTLTLRANVTEGLPSYSYKWSTGQTTDTINVGGENSHATYSVTVTDATGCHATASTTIKVKDVRCGPNYDKVSVCDYDGHSLFSVCVNPVAVPQLLANGSYLGICVDNVPQVTTTIPAGDIINKLHAAIMPNPFTQFFTIKIQSLINWPVSIKVIDAMGVKWEERNNILPGTILHLGQNYPSGIFFVEIKQANEKMVYKVFKQKN